MKRFPLSFRQQIYQEADFYTLTPLARKLVAPGDTITSWIIDARFISAVFDRVRTNPLLAQIWLFYVPHRLVWDQWIDFIALDDAVQSVPTSTTAWAQMFEPGASAKPVLYRRSYKLAYNQYFGDEKIGQSGFAWYDDITADTYVSLNRLLGWDQMRASLSSMGAYTQSAFTATVTGATASIPLDDFARAMRNNTARRRQKLTGDKYVDTMRQMGVELDWQVQMAPEYLGSGQAILVPRERAGSGDATSIATRVCEFSGKLVVNLRKRCAFAEHGYLIAVCGFRPSLFIADTVPADGVTTNQGYYRPDADNIADIQGVTMRERFGHYLKGFNLQGGNVNGNVMTLPAGSAGFYPDPALYAVSDGSGPRHMAMTADVSIKGLTPVPGSRA